MCGNSLQRDKGNNYRAGRWQGDGLLLSGCDTYTQPSAAGFAGGTPTPQVSLQDGAQRGQRIVPKPFA